MHRQLVLVGLQRVLQLNDGARDVAPFVALQRVFVEARGLRGILGLRKRRGSDEQGGQQAG
jgi:hypothetical protein